MYTPIYMRSIHTRLYIHVRRRTLFDRARRPLMRWARFFHQGTKPAALYQAPSSNSSSIGLLRRLLRTFARTSSSARPSRAGVGPIVHRRRLRKSRFNLRSGKRRRGSLCNVSLKTSTTYYRCGRVQYSTRGHQAAAKTRKIV